MSLWRGGNGPVALWDFSRSKFQISTAAWQQHPALPAPNCKLWKLHLDLKIRRSLRSCSLALLQSASEQQERELQRLGDRFVAWAVWHESIFQLVGRARCTPRPGWCGLAAKCCPREWGCLWHPWGAVGAWQWGRRVLEPAEPPLTHVLSLCGAFLPQPAAVRGRGGRIPEEKGDSKCLVCVCSSCRASQQPPALSESVTCLQWAKSESWQVPQCSADGRDKKSALAHLETENPLRAKDGWWCCDHLLSSLLNTSHVFSIALACL